MTITFINYPPFTVNFKEFEKSAVQTECNQKSQSVALTAFEQISLFFLAVKESALQTKSFAKKSFVQIVLNDFGCHTTISLTIDLVVIIFKIQLWAAWLFWETLRTSVVLFIKKTTPFESPEEILRNSNEEIDFEHFKVRTSLDASNVPEEINLDRLLIEFDKIQFGELHKDDLFYMPPQSESEDSRTGIVKPEELRKRLITFIERVKKREAFLGTPPKNEMDRLETFYRQIEDAVRLSLFKVVNDVEVFEKQNRIDPEKGYEHLTVSQKNVYRNLLENRARFVLDLSTIAVLCGSRYLAEAMNAYYRMCEADLNAESLQEDLKGVLAKKRMEIVSQFVNPHSYNAFLQFLGSLLGIPGSKNVIEQIHSGFNNKKTIHSFLKFYTVNSIITSVQKRYTESSVFRNKIIDWLKTESRDWNKEYYEAIFLKYKGELGNKIEGILQEKEDKDSLLQPIIAVFSAFQEIKEKPQKENWQDFIEEIFSSNQIRTKFPDRNIRINLKNDFITHQKLYEDYFFSNAEIDQEQLIQRKIFEQKKQKILALSSHYKVEGKEEDTGEMNENEIIQNAIIFLNMEVFKKNNWREYWEGTLKNALEVIRQNHFITALKINHESLSKELLEWLLVSHHILLPQKTILKKIDFQQVKNIYENFVYPRGKKFRAFRPKLEEFLLDFDDCISKLPTEEQENFKIQRYEFIPLSKDDRNIHKLFYAIFLSFPKDFIREVFKLDPSTQPIIYEKNYKELFIDKISTILNKKITFVFFLTMIGCGLFKLFFTFFQNSLNTVNRISEMSSRLIEINYKYRLIISRLSFLLLISTIFLRVIYQFTENKIMKLELNKIIKISTKTLIINGLPIYYCMCKIMEIPFTSLNYSYRQVQKIQNYFYNRNFEIDQKNQVALKNKYQELAIRESWIEESQKGINN